MKKTILLNSYDNHIQQYFKHLGYKCVVSGTSDDDVIYPDMLVFTDGCNVNPSLSGIRTNKNIKARVFNIRLDWRDVRLFNEWPVTDVPRFGFGRGAMMLNILNGGRMYQDVNNHKGTTHPLLFHKTGEIVEGVPSNHNQGMIRSLSFDSTSYASSNVANQKIEATIPRDLLKNDWNDIEILGYDHSNSLCWQPPVYSMEEYPLKSVLLSYLDTMLKQRELP